MGYLIKGAVNCLEYTKKLGNSTKIRFEIVHFATFGKDFTKYSGKSTKLSTNLYSLLVLGGPTPKIQ